MFYIGVAIVHSASHTQKETAKAAAEAVWEMPVVDPAHLADLLWNMHQTREQAETSYP
jgi:hypothetical protein